MKSIQSAFLALFVVLTVMFSPLFSTGAAWAYGCDTPVPGSYAQTCGYCEAIPFDFGYTLEGDCKNINGSYEYSSINWQAGDPPVSNCDGQLTIGYCW